MKKKEDRKEKTSTAVTGDTLHTDSGVISIVVTKLSFSMYDERGANWFSREYWNSRAYMYWVHFHVTLMIKRNQIERLQSNPTKRKPATTSTIVTIDKLFRSMVFLCGCWNFRNFPENNLCSTKSGAKLIHLLQYCAALRRKYHRETLRFLLTSFGVCVARYMPYTIQMCA